MKRVVIVGGGYGGLRAAEKLAGYRHIEVTLIDKHPWHYLQTEAYAFISGRLNVCDMTYRYETFAHALRGVRFVQDEVTAVKEGRAVCRNQGEIAFDALVLAVGARDLIPASLAPFTYRIKELSGAYGVRERFASLLYEKTTDRKEAVRIVICGAGQSGVELAADMMSYARECSSEAGGRCGVEVILVEGGAQILPGASRSVRRCAMRRLKKLGVRLKLNTFIDKADAQAVYIAGEAIAYDLFVFAGGIRPAALLEALPYAKTDEGFLRTDGYLRVADKVYAIGDCAWIDDGKGMRLAPTAQIAEQSAEYVAKAIAKGVRRPFRGRIYGMFTALGKRYGCGEMFGAVPFRGVAAYAMKRMIASLYAKGVKIETNLSYRLRRHRRG